MDPREWRRNKGTEQIKALPPEQWSVEEFTPYHFRINGVLDVFPTNRRYHDLVTNRRGWYKAVPELLQQCGVKPIHRGTNGPQNLR